MSSSIHWQQAAAETVAHLQQLLRLDTINPPGNEMIAADYLARALRADGIEPLVLESAPGRGNVIARLKGTGEKPPLLLYCHTDVVPAEPQHWQHPPFGGEIADGFVWGRGALDMKNTVAQQLVVMLLLKRSGITLNRDIIYAATADEEVGGADGAGVSWLVKHHPDLLKAEFGITEIGGFNVTLAGANLYPIQVAEKGTCWLTVRARGRPGHASMPHNDNAVAHLTAAVQKLVRRGTPFHLCQPVEGFLDATASAVGGAFGAVLASLKNPFTADLALRAMGNHPQRPMLNAILRNTATPTGLTAGYKTNVIPGTAEAVIDGRTLPGFDSESFIAELRSVMGDHLEYIPTMISPPIQTRFDTPLFKTLGDAIKRHDPTANIVPYMMGGATDAKYLAPLGVPTYGFTPLKLPPGFIANELFHAHNERVPVEGLGWGLRVLYDAITDYCGQN